MITGILSGSLYKKLIHLDNGKQQEITHFSTTICIDYAIFLAVQKGGRTLRRMKMTSCSSTGWSVTVPLKRIQRYDFSKIWKGTMQSFEVMPGAGNCFITQCSYHNSIQKGTSNRRDRFIEVTLFAFMGEWICCSATSRMVMSDHYILFSM